MILCVETNFLLELAYLQDEHDACGQLIALVENGQIRLAIPAFCLVEARESLRQRERQRSSFLQDLHKQLRELERLGPHKTIRSQSESLLKALESGEEMRRLEAVLSRLSGIVSYLPFTEASANDGRRFELEHELPPYDALVFAVIRTELAANAAEVKCFVTKNSKDFAAPNLVSDLEVLNCKLLFRFQDALGWIQSQFPRPSKP